jgi:phosphonate transport system permease protein
MKLNYTFITGFIVFVLTLIFSYDLEINYLQLFDGLGNLQIFLSDTFPLDKSTFQIALISVYETLQIAFLGTVIGAVISLPLATLASRNLFSSVLTAPVRFILAAVRTFPSLLWAILFVMIVGLGPFAGILATTFYTIGYLSKMFYEAIEGVDPESMLALKGIGASKFQLIQHIIIPEAGNHLLSQLLFIFEYNVRGSTILGFVGAGGVGFYISSYLKLLQYDKIGSILCVLFIVVLLIDYFSTKVRDKFLIK